MAKFVSGKVGQAVKTAVQSIAKISCPSCDTPIVAKDLDLKRIFVSCRQCGTSFDYTTQLAPEDDVTPSRDEVVERPDGLEVFDEEDDFDRLSTRDESTPRGRLTIVRRWSSRAGLLVALAAGVCNAVTVFALIDGTVEIALLLGLAIGSLLLTYVGIALFVNRTTITVDRNRLTVRNGPLPWWGRRELASKDVLRLYCRQVVSEDPDDDSRTASYLVDVATKEGKRLVLLSSLPTVEQARYIHRRLARHLKIETP